MLVYFSAENFRSIKEPIELDMRAAPKLRRLAHHTRKPISKNKLKLLKTALIYGANASGKSNILKAMNVAQNLIIDSQTSVDILKTQKFSLVDKIEKNSSFYFEFIIGKTHLTYGFEISDERVIEEELGVYDDKGDNLILVFKRTFNNVSNEYVIESESDKILSDDKNAFNEFKILCKYTPKDQLLLNKSSDWDDSSDLKAIGSCTLAAKTFFQHFLVIIFPTTSYGGLPKDLNDLDNSGNYLSIFNKFDTGVDSIIHNSIPIERFDLDVIDEIKKKISESGGGALKLTVKHEEYIAWFKGGDIIISSLQAVHKIKGVEDKIFNLKDESDGTIRLLDLLPTLRNSDELTSTTFVIDEFDRSLHPNLSRSIIENFIDCENENNNQLIVTTHQSELLDSKLLRRDEIWFVQKEWDQSSKLYSLDDYSERFDKDIQKAYLSGKYGAVPVLSESESHGN